MWQPQGLYSQFVLRTPVILLGREAARGLFDYPGERFAVIHGTSLSAGDMELLERIFKKKDVRFIQRSWNQEPSLDDLTGTIREMEEYRPDVVVAFGGGSVMDGAKLCRLFYEFPYMNIPDLRLSDSDLKTKFIAIPTTVGSGAEVSSAAVYWSPDKRRKEMVVFHALQPEVVVYDSEYIKGTPEKILYTCVLDGMAHIIEGYVSNVGNQFAETLGEKGLEIFCRELRNGKTIDYGQLQYAGCLGGIVQNHCIVGAAHGIAHQLTEYGFSHGEAVGLMLAPVMRRNMEDAVCREKYRRLASCAGFDKLEDMFQFIEEILKRGGISERRPVLKGILFAHLDDMIENIVEDRGGKGNPVPINREYVETVIRSL